MKTKSPTEAELLGGAGQCSAFEPKHVLAYIDRVTHSDHLHGWGLRKVGFPEFLKCSGRRGVIARIEEVTLLTVVTNKHIAINTILDVFIIDHKHQVRLSRLRQCLLSASVVVIACHYHNSSARC